MAIVNGQYVYDTVPSNFTDQSVTGITPQKRDWSDSKQAQYNYILKQQEQAYNLELWNLQNQYNSPAAQMQRYLDAGLNPHLIYSQQNQAQAPASASASPFRSSGNYNRSAQNAISMMSAFRAIVQDAWETYKYFSPYERNLRSFEQQNAGISLRRNQAEADWTDYLTYGRTSFEEPASLDMVKGGYRSQMYNLEANNKAAAYERMVALVNMIPDQRARIQALKALDDKRLQIMQGQNDAVLNISTGNSTVDAWLKALMYFAMSNL